MKYLICYINIFFRILDKDIFNGILKESIDVLDLKYNLMRSYSYNEILFNEKRQYVIISIE